MAFLSFELRTARAPEDVERVLKGLTRAPSWRERVEDGIPFRGAVLRRSFSLREVTDWRHHYRPVLLGDVSAEGAVTVVRVRVRPSWGARIALGIGLTAVALNHTGLPLLAAAMVGLPLMLVLSMVFADSGEKLLVRALATEMRL